MTLTYFEIIDKGVTKYYSCASDRDEDDLILESTRRFLGYRANRVWLVRNNGEVKCVKCRRGLRDPVDLQEFFLIQLAATRLK